MNHEEIKLKNEERKEYFEQLQNIADLEELFQANVSERFNTSGRREHRIENTLLQKCESTTEISGKTLISLV